MKKFAFFFLILFSCCAFADDVKIGGVEVERHKYYDDFYIDVSSDLQPKAQLLDGRLVLDFKGVEIGKAKSISIAKSKRVSADFGSGSSPAIRWSRASCSTSNGTSSSRPLLSWEKGRCRWRSPTPASSTTSWRRATPGSK